MLNRQFKAGISDHALADLVISLREDGRLCRVTEDVKIARAADHLLHGPSTAGAVNGTCMNDQSRGVRTSPQGVRLLDAVLENTLAGTSTRRTLTLDVDGTAVHVDRVAEKRGFVCHCRRGDSIPDRQTRLKIEHEVTKSAQRALRHLCDGRRPAGLAVGSARARQAAGQPDHSFDTAQSGDRLIQLLHAHRGQSGRGGARSRSST